MITKKIKKTVWMNYGVIVTISHVGNSEKLLGLRFEQNLQNKKYIIGERWQTHGEVIKN